MVTDGIDVLVVGSGLAGVSAAIEAARAGARVALASLGDTFSGSSFYGGTWGLGLVGPADECDVDDFVATILDVGRGAADPTLVRMLVEGVDPAIAWLEGMGVELRRPSDATQRAYVPCFDHRQRGWHGLVRASLREAWNRELDRLGVTLAPRTELLDLMEEDGHVSGALVANHATGRILHIPCGSVVLATGGLAGLYERRLTADDSCGAAHGIALAHGCELVNVEFLQMMPGLLSPVSGVVVNEKALRFSTVGMDPEVLDERSGYGPFTSRLPSSAFDLAVAAAGPDGLPLSFDLPAGADELVTGYFDWLRSSFGISPEDEVRVALFAHASNGGIRIAPDASCVGGPAGLFAGGECAGGMHGADRIGGLASAAALVFGHIAGRSAAAEAGRGHGMPTEAQGPWEWSPEASRALASLRREMTAHAMVVRTEEGLSSALSMADDLRRVLGETLSPTTDARQAALTRRTSLQLVSARAMLGAMLARRESRGSHHRADHPGEDPAMARRAGVGLQSTEAPPDE